MTKLSKHPNVVKLIEIIDDPSNSQLFMVLEYIYGGPLLGLNETYGTDKVFSVTVLIKCCINFQTYTFHRSTELKHLLSRSIKTSPRKLGLWIIYFYINTPF